MCTYTTIGKDKRCTTQAYVRISNKQIEEIQSYCNTLQKELEKNSYHGEKIKVLQDRRDMTSGEKKWHWIKKGVPICVEIGPKEVSENTVTLFRRFPDIHAKEKYLKKLSYKFCRNVR